MPPQFTANDALLETRIAQSALTQLNLMAMYPRVCITNYEPGAYEVGNEVKIRRPRRRRATAVHPQTPAIPSTNNMDRHQRFPPTNQRPLPHAPHTTTPTTTPLPRRHTHRPHKHHKHVPRNKQPLHRLHSQH